MKIIKHEPVLASEVAIGLGVHGAHLNSQTSYIDATLGTGGHSLAILASGARVLGIEQDPSILTIACERLCKYGDRFVARAGNFRDIKRIAKDNGFDAACGIVYDLGVNSLQLTDSERGFSFANPEADLDMRLDPGAQGVRACDLLNALRQDQLEELFSQVLPGGEAARLSRKISEVRTVKMFEKVGDFLAIIKGESDARRLNPATLPFLALRIAVNDELGSLTQSLPDAFGLLKPGGRLAVISFHSGEDRIVKNFYKKARRDMQAEIITKKPVVPSKEEKQANPRSRSAKLRILEKKIEQ